jgi:hypothetical protein
LLAHIETVHISEILVGCQAAFASKPAPTVEWCGSAKIGRLSGRHREQASSHIETVHISEILVGCQAAFASRLAHRGMVYTCE